MSTTRITRVQARLAKNEKIRIIIYNRVSTDKQEEEGTSLETQREDNKAYCAERGYIIVDIVDEVHSGYELEQRKKFKTVLKRCISGEIDAIVFRTYDRLTRNKMHFTVLQYDAERYGYELLCVKEKFDNNDIYDRIMRDLMAAFAEIERMKIKDRTIEGKIKRAKDGKLMGGKKARYGYDYNKDHTSYVINEKEAAVICRIDTLYIKGYSQLRIAEILNKEGILSPTGKKVWNHTTVALILECTEYHGEGYSYKTQTIIDENGNKRRELRETKNVIKMPETLYPHIRTRETYNAIQARKKTAHSSSLTTKIPEEIMLKGFVRCAICNRAMHPVINRSKWSGTVHYDLAFRCCASINNVVGYDEKHQLQTMAHILDKAVSEYVKKLLQDLNIIRRALKTYIDQHSSQYSLDAYENAIEQLKARQTELASDLEGTRGNARSLLLAQMNKLEEDIEEIEVQKREIRGDGGQWEHVKRTMQGVIEWLENRDVDFEKASFREKQNFLQALGIVVYVKKGEKIGGKAFSNGYEIKVKLPTLDSIP